MDSGQGSQQRNEDLIPCACGCGAFIARIGTDGRTRRFARGHQFRGNQYGRRAYDAQSILTQAELWRPLFACGCGDKLDIPQFLQQKGKGLRSIQSYWVKHPYKKSHGLWDKRTQAFVTHAGDLSSEIKGLIYGTLLGDGSISYPNPHSRFPRLAWTHAAKQEAWIAYKATRLAILSPKLRKLPNQGYGDFSICCATRCHPQLGEIHRNIKPDGAHKRITQNWLDLISPEGRAWWYMDDGSLALTAAGSPTIQIHTEGFSDAENHLIARWLSKLGYPANVKSYIHAKTQKRYFYIALGTESARRWIQDHYSYAEPSMAYKFRGSNFR